MEGSLFRSQEYGIAGRTRAARQWRGLLDPDHDPKCCGLSRPFTTACQPSLIQTAKTCGSIRGSGVAAAASELLKHYDARLMRTRSLGGFHLATPPGDDTERFAQFHF